MQALRHACFYRDRQLMIKHFSYIIRVLHQSFIYYLCAQHVQIELNFYFRSIHKRHAGIYKSQKNDILTFCDGERASMCCCVGAARLLHHARVVRSFAPQDVCGAPCSIIRVRKCARAGKMRKCRASGEFFLDFTRCIKKLAFGGSYVHTYMHDARTHACACMYTHARM